MRHRLLCATLIGLFAIRPAFAQEMIDIPLQPPAPALPPGPNSDMLGEGTQLRLVLLDSVSSATAAKGQPVRFAVAEDVSSAVPRGTLVVGVVKSAHKGIPGKRNGSLVLVPQIALLPDGRRLKLDQSTDECRPDIAGCWVMGAFVVVGLAIFVPIELPVAAVHAVSQRHRRKLLTPIHRQIEGTDVSDEPCHIYSAYTVHKLQISGRPTPAASADIESTLRVLDACAVH